MSYQLQLLRQDIQASGLLEAERREREREHQQDTTTG
jgi:hypothetical protein